MIKTLKISKLIKELEEIKKAEGDLPIVLASDSEGNSYGALSDCFIYNVQGNVIALYPTFETSEDMSNFIAE